MSSLMLILILMFLEVGIHYATSRSDRPLEQADSIVLPNISLGCIAGKIH